MPLKSVILLVPCLTLLLSLAGGRPLKAAKDSFDVGAASRDLLQDSVGMVSTVNCQWHPCNWSAQQALEYAAAGRVSGSVRLLATTFLCSEEELFNLSCRMPKSCMNSASAPSGPPYVQVGWVPAAISTQDAALPVSSLAAGSQHFSFDSPTPPPAEGILAKVPATQSSTGAVTLGTAASYSG